MDATAVERDVVLDRAIGNLLRNLGQDWTELEITDRPGFDWDRRLEALGVLVSRGYVCKRFWVRVVDTYSDSGDPKPLHVRLEGTGPGTSSDDQIRLSVKPLWNAAHSSGSTVEGWLKIDRKWKAPLVQITLSKRGLQAKSAYLDGQVSVTLDQISRRGAFKDGPEAEPRLDVIGEERPSSIGRMTTACKHLVPSIRQLLSSYWTLARDDVEDSERERIADELNRDIRMLRMDAEDVAVTFATITDEEWRFAETAWTHRAEENGQSPTLEWNSEGAIKRFSAKSAHSFFGTLGVRLHHDIFETLPENEHRDAIEPIATWFYESFKDPAPETLLKDEATQFVTLVNACDAISTNVTESVDYDQDAPTAGLPLDSMDASEAAEKADTTHSVMNADETQDGATGDSTARNVKDVDDVQHVTEQPGEEAAESDTVTEEEPTGRRSSTRNDGDTTPNVEELADKILVTSEYVAGFLKWGQDSFAPYKKEWPDPEIPHSGSAPAWYDWKTLIPVLQEQFSEKRPNADWGLVPDHNAPSNKGLVRLLSG